MSRIDDDHAVAIGNKVIGAIGSVATPIDSMALSNILTGFNASNLPDGKAQPCSASAYFAGCTSKRYENGPADSKHVLMNLLLRQRVAPMRAHRSFVQNCRPGDRVIIFADTLDLASFVPSWAVSRLVEEYMLTDRGASALFGGLKTLAGEA
jgi:hypothetical protein